MSDRDFSNVKVRIIGDHPHAGQEGQPTGKMLMVGKDDDTPMFEIRFPDGTGCYAKYANLLLLKPFVGLAKR